jgi:hypothetical protein
MHMYMRLAYSFAAPFSSNRCAAARSVFEQPRTNLVLAQPECDTPVLLAAI